MKKLFLLALTILMVLFFTFSCFGFDLRKTKNRDYTPYPLSKELKERIDNDVAWMDDPCSVVRYSCALTAELLSFSKTNDIANGKANCIGYARLSSSIFNYAIKVLSNRMEDESLLIMTAHPVVGTVHYCGINLNKLSQKILPQKYKSFYKDHDFMEVDFGSGDIVYADACLYDYFGCNDL